MTVKTKKLGLTCHTSEFLQILLQHVSQATAQQRSLQAAENGLRACAEASATAVHAAACAALFTRW